MLQTAFQKHPEKRDQRLVSARLGGKDAQGGSLLYAHNASLLRATPRDQTATSRL